MRGLQGSRRACESPRDTERSGAGQGREERTARGVPVDGPAQAKPPMSAPLLLWVILLPWASGGGFSRGGRTWQHCTGRSEGRAPGDRSSPSVLPRPGCSPRCQGRAQKACSVLGGMPHVGQPSPSVSVLRVHSSGPRDSDVSGCQDTRAAGCGVIPVPAAPTVPAGGSTQPSRAPCLSLLHKRCPRFCCRQRGGEGLEEGEESHEVPLESPSCPGLSVL